MVLLVLSAAQAASQTVAPLLGMLAGVASAVLLGWLMYAAAARVDVGRLFTWTGVLLVLVAALTAQPRAGQRVEQIRHSGRFPGRSVERSQPLARSQGDEG